MHITSDSAKSQYQINNFINVFLIKIYIKLKNKALHQSKSMKEFYEKNKTSYFIFCGKQKADNDAYE